MLTKPWSDPKTDKHARTYACKHTVPFKILDTPTHSRVFIYFYNFLHCRIIVNTSNYEITQMESCGNQKSVQQMNIYFIFEIVQSSHPLPWWQLCTVLAFSQPASPGMLFQHSWRSSHICWALLGYFSFTLRSNSSHLGWGWVIVEADAALSFLIK